MTATALPIEIPTTLPTWFTQWASRHTTIETAARGRNATLKQCSACRKRILTGDDSNIGAFAVRVDLTPLNTNTELACLIAKRKTFLLEGTPGRITIHARDNWQITGLPPGKNLIVPTHQCGARFPEPPKPKKQKEDHDDECPF